MLRSVLCTLFYGLFCISSAYAALTGATQCAIYWPAFGTSTQGNTLTSQAVLHYYPNQAPWYCNVDEANRVTCDITQANVDLEIQIAQAVGLNCFLYDWYAETRLGGGVGASVAGNQTAFNFYTTSSHKDKLNWAPLLFGYALGNSPFSDTSAWQGHIDYLVSQYLTPYSAYHQKVLTTRPVIAYFYTAADITTYFGGSNANLGTAIAYLRTAMTNASLGDPYIVLMGGTDAILTTIGADARSGYFYSRRLTDAQTDRTYAAFDALVQANWNTLASGGNQVAPILQIGNDMTADIRTPPNWEAGTIFPRMGTNRTWIKGTPAAIAAGQVTAVGPWVEAHAAQTTAKLLIYYAWSEHWEGWQPMQPERGDPPVSSPPYTPCSSTGLSTLLDALMPVICAYH